MKKQLSKCAMYALFCVIIFPSCCRTEPMNIDAYSFGGLVINCIQVDSILKADTAYYKISAFMCDSDTVFLYKYTNLLSSYDQPFKAYFIPYSKYNKSEVSFSLSIPPLVQWENLIEEDSVISVIKQGESYLGSVSIKVNSEYSGKKKTWLLVDTTDAPQKIFYHYNWDSKVHYSYHQYNADAAIVAFIISNTSNDSITPIDSIWLTSAHKKIYASCPSQLILYDTIDIFSDTTYNYIMEGRMKGQSCGKDVYEVRSHKGEIISEQDETNSHANSIYEYDE